jgi:hypothetical protein
VNDASNRLWAGNEGGQTVRRLSAKLWAGAGIAVAVGGVAWLYYFQSGGGTATHAPTQAPPQVVVSRPLERELDTQDKSPKMRLTHFFIDHPRFAIVLSTFVTLLGLGALAVLPVAQYPEVCAADCAGHDDLSGRIGLQPR